MKVSERTTNLLKNYANINQSLEFRAGKVLRTVSPLNTILASVEIEEDFPQTFPIYELGRFLGTLDLFNNPELDFTDNGVSITDDNHEATYRYCGSSSMFQTPPEKDITFPDAEINFELSQDQFRKTINAANTLGLPEVIVEGNGSDIQLVVSDTGNVSSDIFSTKVGATDKTFRMIFKTENLNKIMEGAYNVSLSSKRISHFTRRGDSLQYWIALEQNSTYEE
ncbi:hypothetical protein HX865_01175 [Marine Group I thaumarchaeote]|uniref:Sliding clamp C-terminal domain-containing protein n=1 Tax=Marine Group I thaumarchaeote TaxID=2511932 RepID=A0A7K4N2Z3_9ARCH|nr:hypothetical protein [Marine Group I thaumarchaeote]